MTSILSLFELSQKREEKKTGNFSDNCFHERFYFQNKTFV
jgi:hypothetical protein